MASGETRRFQNTIPPHAKFWQVTQDGRRLSFAWGRIGTAGQTLAKEYSSEWRADREFRELIAEKCGRGYIEVDLRGVPLPVEAPGRQRVTRVQQCAPAMHHFSRNAVLNPTMECVRCSFVTAAPLRCAHPETHTRIADNITRCVACGLVNPVPDTVAQQRDRDRSRTRRDRERSILERRDGFDMSRWTSAQFPSPPVPVPEIRRPPMVMHPADAAARHREPKVEKVELRPRRKITLNED